MQVFAELVRTVIAEETGLGVPVFLDEMEGGRIPLDTRNRVIDRISGAVNAKNRGEPEGSPRGTAK